MHTHKMSLDLPDDLLTEIEHYREVNKESSNSQAIIDLLKHALALPPYFVNFNWGKEEEAADEEIKKGRIKSFANAEELLNDLKS